MFQDNTHFVLLFIVLSSDLVFPPSLNCEFFDGRGHILFISVSSEVCNTCFSNCPSLLLVSKLEVLSWGNISGKALEKDFTLEIRLSPKAYVQRMGWNSQVPACHLAVIWSRRKGVQDFREGGWHSNLDSSLGSRSPLLPLTGVK